MAALLWGLLVILIVSVCLVDGVKECPPWFEWVNASDSSGYCACPREVPPFLYCDERNQRSSISQSSCVFYDHKEDITRGAWCSFYFPADVVKRGLFTLPANVSELNSVVCGGLSREVKPPLCGRCTNGTGPSVYSIGIECVPCSSINILYYLLLQYLPSTVMFILVILFRPNITSAPMANYILFCNLSVLFFWLNSLYFVEPHSFVTHLAQIALTLSAVWSFDALLFISPPLCISHHIQEFHIPFLQFTATVYPFVLLVFTYVVIELHNQNVKPAVALWRLFSRVYVRFYRAWDPNSSMVQAFASLFYLSYARLSYLIWEPFEWSNLRNNQGKPHTKLFYFDPNVPYGSNKHILFMAFSLAVAVFIFLPPLLILVVYPTPLYRKISHWISPKWRLRIKTFVETFNGSFKDGTNGTKDYRSWCGLGLLLFCFIPELFLSIVASININIPEQNAVISTYVTAIFACFLAFLCIWQQPYKEKNSNTLTAGLLILISLLGLGTTGNIQDKNIMNMFMTILLLVPHSAVWGYVVWKVIKIIALRCRKCQTEANREREQLFYSYS